MSNCFFKPYQLERNSKTDLTIKSFLDAPESLKKSISIFGYPDDEGVHINGGRTGAALGPDSIRKALYKMTPTPSMSEVYLKDVGNLSFIDASLDERHSYAITQVYKELISENICIGLGGGHDYGYVDGAAFLKKVELEKPKEKPKEKPIIFNFDAHFDLRNLDKGISSGTPFFRLLNDFENTFELFEIGIQKHCNSQSLFDFAESQKNVHTMSYDNLYPEHVFDFKYFENFVASKTIQKQDCYISVDIDGFSSAFAPGCSQSWPTGFDMSSFFRMFDFLMNRFNVHILGVYEVSPPLDHFDLTSRLAAMVVYRFLEKKASKKPKEAYSA